jgi:hypothetical protein
MLKKRLRSSDLGTKFANAVELIAVEACALIAQKRGDRAAEEQ